MKFNAKALSCFSIFLLTALVNNVDAARNGRATATLDADPTAESATEDSGYSRGARHNNIQRGVHVTVGFPPGPFIGGTLGAFCSDKQPITLNGDGTGSCPAKLKPTPTPSPKPTPTPSPTPKPVATSLK